jgi:hypothetical protein
MDLGLTSLTLKKARSRLASQFTPGDASGPEFRHRVNAVIERFHETDMWVGSHATYRIEVEDDKTFYLPFYLEAILHARIDRRPARTQSSRYEFLYDGVGEVGPDDHMSGTLVDMGVGGISTTFPETPGILQIVGVSSADIGKQIRILGYDANGDRVIRDDGTPGELITLDGDLSVNTTTVFSAVQGIQKENATEVPFAGRVSVRHVSSDTVLAVLEPQMDSPLFHGYRVLDTSAKTVTAFCKRRPVEVLHEEEYLFPGNINALRKGLMSLQFEDEGKLAEARAYFADAIMLLNHESSRYRGGNEEHLQVYPWGVGISGIPNPN